jgi:hypothetical protein
VTYCALRRARATKSLCGRCKTGLTGLTAVDVNTEFQLVALGSPQLPSLDEIVSAEPLVITNPPGHREVIQLVLIQPQDAQGPQWDVIANAPFPTERIRSAYKIVVVKKRRQPGLAGADEWFESLFEEP